MPNTYCLLMYTINDVEKVIKKVQLYHDYFDEICIIDQSPQPIYESLSDALKKDYSSYNIKLKHVPSLGHSGPYYELGLKIADSDYVFRLDLDESISEPLLKNLRNLNTSPAYWIRRLELPSKYYTWQLRIYKKDQIIFKGFLHDQGLPKSSAKVMDRKYHIVHHWKVSDLKNSNKIKRYLALDLIERPLIYRFLFDRLGPFKSFPLKLLFYNKRDELISPILFNIYYYYSKFFQKYYIRVNEEELSLHLDYIKKWYEAIRILPKEITVILVKIYKELALEGVSRYLCLDDMNYISRLSNADLYDVDGLELFFSLLYYRYTNGRCAEVLDKNELLKNNPLYSDIMKVINKLF